MKALIKKYPTNARYESENEVWEEPRWTPAMKDSGNLEPYINEDYGYALCEDCPDVELTVDDFDVTEHAKTVKDDMGEDVEVKYWTAEYIGGVEDGA